MRLLSVRTIQMIREYPQRKHPYISMQQALYIIVMDHGKVTNYRLKNE